MPNLHEQVEPGQRYNRWVVIGEPVRRGYKLFIPCRCDCGTEKEVFIYSLTSGRSKSCGCLRHAPTRRSPKPTPNLVGKRFGKLSVIEDAGKNRKGQTLWLCECDCGNRRVYTTAQLKFRQATSCGCGKFDRLEKANGALSDMQIDGVIVPYLTRRSRQNTTSGHKGVRRFQRSGKVYYQAHIFLKRKRIAAPVRSDIDSAIADRKRLEEMYHKPYIEKFKERRSE
jgi:hypothetical protein